GSCGSSARCRFHRQGFALLRKRRSRCTARPSPLFRRAFLLSPATRCAHRLAQPTSLRPARREFLLPAEVRKVMRLEPATIQRLLPAFQRGAGSYILCDSLFRLLFSPELLRTLCRCNRRQPLLQLLDPCSDRPRLSLLLCSVRRF